MDPAPPAPATIGGEVRALRHALRSAGAADAGATSEWAAAHVLGRRRLELRALAALPFPPDRRGRWATVCAALRAGVPLAYALGDAEFRGRVFACDPRALIPRPETEELAGLVLDAAGLRALTAPRIADIGTGSGVIAVTLALDRPGVRVIATDRSADALALARENARRHGVGDRIAWRQGDLLEGFAPGALDAIVANLPYVASAEIPGLDASVRDHEPRAALDGGPDGLALLDRLIARAPAALARPGWIFLEIGEDQGAAVRSLLARAGFRDAEIARDLAGHDRFATGRRD